MITLKELYGHAPTGKGLTYEGRGMYDEWTGSIQPPSAIVKDQTITFAGYETVRDPYLGVIKTRVFKFSEKLFIDVTDRIKEEPQRMGTIAFWHDSFIEQIRKSKRFSLFISKTQILADLKLLALQYKSVLLDALILYYTGVLNEGTFTQEQFTKDLKSKEDSSTGFEGFSKNRDVLNAPNIQAIYAREVKETKTELEWLIEHLKLAKDGKYDFGLIDPNHTINALRCKPPKLNYDVVTMDTVEGYFNCYRSRCAGGVERISRLSWPIYKTAAKKAIMKRLCDFLGKAFDLEIHSLDIESVQFYIGAFEQQLECYDVINAEKTWGIVFEHILPGIIDFSLESEFPNEFAAALQSGIDITRIINWFGALLIIAWLRKEGRLPKEKFSIWMGGDNIAIRQLFEKPKRKEGENEEEYLTRLITEDKGLWHIIEEDTRILGFNPKLGRIGGLHHSIDGVDSMVSFRKGTNSFRWTQTQQTLSRVMDAVVQLDLYQKGTCLKFYKWIMENHLLDDPSEVYNHDALWATVGMKFLEVIETMVPGITEWTKAAFTINNDLPVGRFVSESDCIVHWFNSKTGVTG